MPHARYLLIRNTSERRTIIEPFYDAGALKRKFLKALHRSMRFFKEVAIWCGEHFTFKNVSRYGSPIFELQNGFKSSSIPS